MILGYWKTEKEIWGGFKVPLSPNIEIKKNSFILVTKDGKHDMPIENIEVENSSVTINFKETSVSLVFVFENKDRMYFRVPYIRKRIYFVRSKPF
ncbi:MAG: hypothetical protein KBA61_17525 [Spirochaetes bacterium]|nr:hypothetical protein [Spirochaetota bacterium]